MLPFFKTQDPVMVPYRPDHHFRLLHQFTGMLVMSFHQAIFNANQSRQVQSADYMNEVKPHAVDHLLGFLRDVQDFVGARRSRDNEVNSYIVAANMFAERLTITVGHHDGRMSQIVFTGYNPQWMTELKTKLNTGGDFHKHSYLRDTFSNMRRHISVTQVFPEPSKQAA